jgi:hypothetical protein
MCLLGKNLACGGLNLSGSSLLRVLQTFSENFALQTPANVNFSSKSHQSIKIPTFAFAGQ